MPVISSECTPADAGLELDWPAAIDRLEGAYSAHTLRAYRGDFRLFAGWCATQGLVSLPAAPQTVEAFIAADTSSAASLRRRIAAVQRVHTLMELPNPIITETVRIALRRARRQRAGRQRQALGLTRDLRDQLIAACPATLRGLRDRALVSFAYDTLARRDELRRIRVEDVQPLGGGGALVLIPRSKSDPFNHGRHAWASDGALGHLGRWCRAADLRTGPLFRGVSGSRISSEALAAYSVSRIMKDLGRQAALPAALVANLSGHSARVGAAQDMAVDGFGVLAIAIAGGWRSVNNVLKYVGAAEAERIGQQRQAGGPPALQLDDGLAPRSRSVRQLPCLGDWEV